MSAAKQVLLARPHSFIVSEMRPFLEKGGFASCKLDSIHPNAENLPLTSATESDQGLGRENVFLVRRREDLAAGASAELAERILRKHFR